MYCSANLFSRRLARFVEHNNVFYVRGYSVWRHAFHLLYAITAEGINGGSERYRLMVAFPTRRIYGRDSLRSIAGQCGKTDT